MNGKRRPVTVLSFALAFAGIFMFFLGCGEQGPAMYRCAGVVTFNGQPLEKGDIIFRPVGSGRPDGAAIVDGKFECRLTVGQKEVVINAMSKDLKLVKHKLKNRNVAPQIALQYLPDRYNKETTLTAEVVAKNGLEFNFDLISK